MWYVIISTIIGIFLGIACSRTAEWAQKISEAQYGKEKELARGKFSLWLWAAIISMGGLLYVTMICAVSLQEKDFKELEHRVELIERQQKEYNILDTLNLETYFVGPLPKTE